MYTYSIKKHELQFVKPAKTSRNIFKTRTVYFITMVNANAGKQGVGEASPLSLLSIDDVEDYSSVLQAKLEEFCEVGDINEMDFSECPSIKFGIETALLDMNSDDDGRMYQTDFTQGKENLLVNGLVWMNDADVMYQEALTKIEAGFDVIKFKVGALDFDEECKMLEKIRKQYSAFKITLRLDANGAFGAGEAMEQLKELSRFEIHSIEQPIATKQPDDMQRICALSPIDVALDEELIGVDPDKEGSKMLQYIKPHYLILKPNLIGGLGNADKWVNLAQKNDIKWWATSALESNVGLNAIAQWVSQYDNPLHQGLGTGGLFTNNTPTQLSLKDGRMKFVV